LKKKKNLKTLVHIEKTCTKKNFSDQRYKKPGPGRWVGSTSLPELGIQI